MVKKVTTHKIWKNTPIGRIPKDWEVCELGSISLINSKSLSDNTKPEYEFKYVDLSCVSKGYVAIPTDVIKYYYAPDRAKRIFSRGDILLSMVRPNLLGYAYIDFDADDMICSTGFSVISVNNETNPLYIYYYLYSHRVQKYFELCIVGSGYPALSVNDVKRLLVPLPKKSEQKKIADVIGVWDFAIEQMRKLIDAKHRLKKGLMQQLLTGRLRFPEFAENTHDSTHPWEYVRLTQIASGINRKNEEALKPVLTASGKLGLVDQEEYFNRSVSSEDLTKYWLLREGEFAYNRSSMNDYPFGAIKRLMGYDHGALSTLYICFRIENQDADPEFYRFFFESGLLDRQLRGITQVGARVHGLLNVTKTDFMAIRVPLPSVQEQALIAGTLKACEEGIELLKAELDQLLLQKRGMMQKLLTGEVRVKVNHESRVGR